MDLTSIIKVEPHPDWWTFTQNITEKDNSLFRGHSNFYFNKNGIEEKGTDWQIISTFNRAYPSSEFTRYHYQQFWDNYPAYQGGNKILKDFNNESALARIQFFQHYGIPTPLIDFTRNPLTALFFAAASMTHHGVISSDSERYITVVEVNTKALQDDFGIKEIVDQNVDFDTLIKNSKSNLRTPNSFIVPKPDFSANGNLERQQGAFIYFDCTYSLEEFLGECHQLYGVDVSQAPITFHTIPYASFRGTSHKHNYPNLFYFLMKKKKIGKYLFDDIQGAKYDYNIPAILSALNCEDKKECECSRTLDQYNISI